MMASGRPGPAKRLGLLLGSVVAFMAGVALMLASLAPLVSHPHVSSMPPPALAIARGTRVDAHPPRALVALPDTHLPAQATETGTEISMAAAWRPGQNEARSNLRASLLEVAALIHTPPLGRNDTPPHPHGVD
jgi:hypothetical protein